MRDTESFGGGVTVQIINGIHFRLFESQYAACDIVHIACTCDLSRDGFRSPFPRQPAHPHTQAEYNLIIHFQLRGASAYNIIAHNPTFATSADIIPNGIISAIRLCHKDMMALFSPRTSVHYVVFTTVCTRSQTWGFSYF